MRGFWPRGWPEMGPPSVTVANERVKMFASLLFNSGGALAAATIVKVYSDPKIDISVVAWSAAACALM